MIIVCSGNLSNLSLNELFFSALFFFALLKSSFNFLPAAPPFGVFVPGTILRFRGSFGSAKSASEPSSSEAFSIGSSSLLAPLLLAPLVAPLVPFTDLLVLDNGGLCAGLVLPPLDNFSDRLRDPRREEAIPGGGEDLELSSIQRATWVSRTFTT